ncbi:homoserine kinase [Thalassotalea profundi]|uniref:Homoserine kinase n=1 Tax=Thalassotalea profundi TaxID=2036687 RepID=A0ABQ3IXW5_9GAMM|nr:homoserine kinase [Thalassotalea profundi]GHE94696.1 homoserine kinase [Thalassotalea profundi]
MSQLMSKLDGVSVFAPASIGNVSVGFDVLGLGVKPIDGTLLGDVVSIVLADEDSLTVVGEFAKKLPGDVKDNIVWHCLLLFNKAMAEAGYKTEKLALTLDKKMPVGSGLGSSACSVVAALEALNQFYQQYNQTGFDRKKMLLMMGEMEAQISGSLHYDNVAPCYLGGMQLMVPDADIISRNLPQFDDCFYVMAYPGISVSTKAAREVLPPEYSRADLIHFGQNLATFVDACHRNDKVQAFSVLTDVVAEPYRQHLLPKFAEAKQYLLSQGSLAVGISGSGPTLFCVVDDEDKAKEFEQWLTNNYLQTEADGNNYGFVHVCKVDSQGACVLNTDT